MSNPDQIQRFVFDNAQVRGVITGIQESYAEVLSRDSYPRPVQILLGELLAACALFSTILKFEGRLSIQARTEGALKMIQAECNHQADLRAIARWEGEISDDDSAISLLQQGGQMAITIEPEQGQRYQGVVALEGDTLAACLQEYFNRSEQLPTRIHLSANGIDAAGMMLQVLPESAESSQQDEDCWNRLDHLVATLSDEELLGLDNETVLTRLFHEEEVRVFPVQDLRFHCDCSRERCGSALVSLAREELEEILSEQPVLEVSCQFCNERYEFDRSDIEVLFNPGAIAGDNQQIH
ncbi:Hsp33 family molecular chaperone HslO [Balneatrix alpica]|uniref:33 kDa chaperonin n=1 Tax=Balneatrix alpica TaxID=75684 RepID=A0ABV5ZII3_9GAMM|nr:Hsp33 family molecular chaperone HslO [Balneatrix alpica]